MRAKVQIMAYYPVKNEQKFNRLLPWVILGRLPVPVSMPKKQGPVCR